MADLGIHATPERTPGESELDHYRRLLDGLPDAFSTVWVSDHMQFGDDPTHEAWTLMSFLAAAFPRFNVGSLVLGQSYRNPALLAKMAATLQELSNGRLILGLGAGWHEEEYRAYNFEYPRPGVRVAQLAETIQIIKAMWTQSPATFHGEHYRIDGAQCIPMPETPIPVLVGTERAEGPRRRRPLRGPLVLGRAVGGHVPATARHPARALRSDRPAVRGHHAHGRPDDRAARRPVRVRGHL